jgi:hypothetical protein
MLVDGTTLLGQAVYHVGATSVTVTTSGAAGLANGVHNLTATQTLANYAWSVGNRSGTSDLASLASAALGVTVDAAAPTVAVAPFDVSVAPHGLTLTFSEDVVDTLAAGDLKVTNLTTGATVGVATMTGVAGGGYRFTFDAPGGVLPDGNYRATIAAGDVTDRAGNALAAGAVVDFYVLGGDANRDRVVNFADLLVLARNYNGTGKGYAGGDFNYDGVVNFGDLLILARAYNKTLAVPPPAPAPALLVTAPVVAPVSASILPGSSGTEDRNAKAVFSTKPVPKPLPAKPKPVAKGGRRG